MPTSPPAKHGLRRLLHSERADIFLYACNGHGVWEAVIENLAAPGQAVLIPGTGHFSESWAVQTEALGRRVVRTPWREGWPIDAAAVEQALRDDTAHEIRALFAVHTDTASGVTSDIARAAPRARCGTPPGAAGGRRGGFAGGAARSRWTSWASMSRSVRRRRA